MSSKSEGQHQLEAPGTISILSRDNTIHNPSLIQDIWEFEHDPEDEAIKIIIGNKEKDLKARHSLQKIEHGDEGQTKTINPQKLAYHSQLVQFHLQQKRSEYGLEEALNTNDRKTISKKVRRKNEKQKQKQRRSKLLYKQQISNVIPEVVHLSTQELQTIKDKQSTRVIDILQHKEISNLNYLIGQKKELLYLLRFTLIEQERQIVKKQLMKMDIECRKLKIGLRSYNSSTYFHDKKKPSKELRFGKSIKRDRENRQKYLTQEIMKQKKRMYEFSTRQSLLNNYYNAMKIKSKKVQNIPFPNRRIQRSRSPQSNSNDKIKREIYGCEYHELLMNKRKILFQSVEQTKTHIKRKCQQIYSQNKLLKQQLFFLQCKISKLQGMEKQYRETNPRKSSKNNIITFGKKSNVKLQPYFSKTKRKLQINRQTPSDQSYYQKVNQHNFIGRVKSHKDFQFFEKEKSKSKEKEENEYFPVYRYHFKDNRI